MKKKLVFLMLVLVSFIYPQGKVNNINTFLPNKIALNSFSENKGVLKNDTLTLKKDAFAKYLVNVKASGIYKVLLKVSGNRESTVALSESIAPEVLREHSLEYSLDDEIIENYIYFDKNSKFLKIETLEKEINIKDIIINYVADGGLIGVEGAYSFANKKINLLGDEIFTLIPSGLGFYRLLSFDGEYVFAETDKGQIKKEKWVNEDYQIWKLQKTSQGLYQFINKNSGNTFTWKENEMIVEENKNLKNQSFKLNTEETINYSKEEKEWKLVWNDEFDYKGLPDPNKWSFDVRGPGWVNDELQAYTDKKIENARVENGKLIIEGRKNGNDYTSARIKTEGKGDWLYGKVVVRAKLPKGRGVWPAIWMMPTDNKYGSWPNSGEIDIMEYVGHEPGRIHASMHSKDMNFMNGAMRTSAKYIGNVEDEFHDYILLWEEDGITISVDDIVVGKWATNPTETWESWPWHHRFHLILNMAIGGSWGGQQGVDDSIWPQKMEVEYVRIYQK